jgi:hypothetical protein
MRRGGNRLHRGFVLEERTRHLMGVIDRMENNDLEIP